MQLRLGGSTQGINNATTTSSEHCRQTNQVAWSTRPHLVDNSRPSLAPRKYWMTYKLSDNACSQQPSMFWIHRRPAHHDIFYYFMLQTVIGFHNRYEVPPVLICAFNIWYWSFALAACRILATVALEVIMRSSVICCWSVMATRSPINTPTLELSLWRVIKKARLKVFSAHRRARSHSNICCRCFGGIAKVFFTNTSNGLWSVSTITSRRPYTYW